MKTSVASTTRSFLLRLACSAALVLASTLLCRAGGPKNVAGTSYFDPSVTASANAFFFFFTRPASWA